MSFLDEFDDTTVIPGGTAKAKLDAWTFMGNLKAYPLTGRFQPYVVGGAGVIDGDLEVSANVGRIQLSVSEEATEAILKFGAGLDAYINPNWAVNVEFAHYWPTGDLRDFEYDLVSFGVVYRF